MDKQYESLKSNYTVVLPTLGRVDDVLNFLNSVFSQTLAPHQVIIIDQNRDATLIKAVAKAFPAKSEIMHVKVDWVGLSRARNVGLGMATTPWVFFGDDDSFLPANYFETLIPKALEKDLAAISTRIVDSKTSESMLNQPQKECKVNAYNIHNTTCEGATLWNRKDLLELDGYNEALGLGRYFSAEEGADLIMRALNIGKSIMFTPKPTVDHPSQRNADPERFLNYARGTGFYIRRHIKEPAVWLFFAIFITKNLLGLALKINSDTGRKKHMNRLKGLFQGIYFYPKEPSR